MAIERSQVLEDLSGIVRGELLFDDVSRVLYATDASVFQVQPLGVVAPLDEEDVVAIVRYAAEHNLPIVGRGAGSGLAGEALGSGLILDFSRGFRRIGRLEGDRITVQPGVVLRTLNEDLAKHGLRFPPDPASATQCTIGGMLANNASGTRSLKYGYTRDHVASIRMVFDDGTVSDCGHESLLSDSAQPSRKQDIVANLARILDQNTDLIRASAPRTPFNRCGYLLDGVRSPAGVRLPKILVGSEGTLGLFTEARLQLLPLPVERSLVFLAFASVDAALQAVPTCVAFGPAACELIERRLLTLTCDARPEYERIVPPVVQAVLLVEFEEEQQGKANGSGWALLKSLKGAPELVEGLVATEPEHVEWLWQLRDQSLPQLHALPGRDQPLPFIEDVAVPVDALGTYLHGLQEILRKHQITASYLVHAGTGQVHARPFLDITQPANVERLQVVAEETYRLALDLGGTISTQHAVGMARTSWVPQQYGRLYPVLRDIKMLFDPRNLLNPGKIVDLSPGAATGGNVKPALATLVRREATVLPEVEKWRLRWELDLVQDQCQKCNGCGACRTEAPSARMCPTFRATGKEAATPRAKANLLRALLDGTLTRDQLSSDEVRQVSDYCINCKMCAVECPARVDIPRLMLEAKAQHAAEHGLRLTDWVMARSESFAALGSGLALLVNPALRSHGLRWLMERFLGVARHRKLPAFARQSFLQIAERRGWTRQPRTPGVAYFVDVFANYNDPSIAEATVAVLHHNGIEVYVPPDQVGCGIAPLAHGDVDTARRVAEHNVRIFADLARAGYTIVCSEPTAALMLRQDYLHLLDDRDVPLIADRTVELMAFLGSLRKAGRLNTDFRPLDLGVGHHVPCHIKALGQGIAGPELLALIPHFRGHTIDVGCSGMAGTFGLRADSFELSLAAGSAMLEQLRSRRMSFGSSECSPCRMQMEQGSRKRCLHPVQFLALSYGLMPEIAQRLKPI